MNTYILVLYMFAVPLAKGDPVETHMVAQKTLASCMAEGRRQEALFQGSAKALRFTCLKAARTES